MTKVHSPNTTCSYCGKAIYRAPSQLKLYSTRYCNLKCSGKGQNNIAKANKKKPSSIIYQCKICSKPFQMIASDIERISQGKKASRRNGHTCGDKKCEKEYKKQRKISEYNSFSGTAQWDYSLQVAEQNSWSNAKSRNAKMPFQIRKALGPMKCGVGNCTSDYTSSSYFKQGKVPLHVHHLLNYADGGPDHLFNLVAACPQCHAYLDVDLSLSHNCQTIFDYMKTLNPSILQEALTVRGKKISKIDYLIEKGLLTLDQAKPWKKII